MPTTATDPERTAGSTIDPLTAVRIGLRGIGQVMFQGHAGTGLLFLIGVAVATPLTAVGAVIGAVLGPVLARLLKFDRQEIEDGIYGFNPTLVGIATLFYLKPAPMTWGLLLVGCAASTVVTYLCRRFLKFPTYTGPFVVCTWILLLAAHAIAGTAIDLKPAPPELTPRPFFEAVLNGPAEVMFGANIFTGLLFLAGIALSNWRHAVLALGGSVVGTLVAYYHHDADSQISIGIYGYNAALTAIALYLWRKSLLLPILGSIVAVLLTEFFPKSLGVPPLTGPFVAASWVVLAVGAVEPYFCRD